MNEAIFVCGASTSFSLLTRLSERHLESCYCNFDLSVAAFSFEVTTTGLQRITCLVR